MSHKHDKKDELKEAVKEAQAEEKEKCESKIDSKDEKIEELTNMLRRTQADFINFKDRVEREKEDSKIYFKKEIITSLLPVVDMFELALKHTENKEEFVKGMEMIYAQFFATLENEGLKLIDANQEFNPEFHEAILTEDSTEKEGTILEELQKGYELSGRVLRCSRVKVAKKHEENKEN
ncbi:nucleotide exchange factor GrpE [Candidatus Woesearchaeota archaeon]|nr:nucleotide exchange factor GrpE [Candidatus Woesearchaeota archaeon]